jgi:hypothetical protein
LAADEAEFSRIAHGQYAIFIALRREPSLKRQKVSNSLSNYSKRRKINLKKEKEQLLWLKNFLNTFLVAIESRNYKINFTMFITIKAVSREAGTM